MKVSQEIPEYLCYAVCVYNGLVLTSCSNWSRLSRVSSSWFLEVLKAIHSNTISSPFSLWHKHCSNTTRKNNYSIWPL